MARRRSVQNIDYGIKLVASASDIITIDNPAYDNAHGLGIEFWFKTPSSPTSTMSIYSEGNSGNAFPFWLIVWDAVTSNLELQKRSDIGGQFVNPIFTGFNFVPGKDYHVAIIDDLAAKAAKLYVNGSLQQTVVYGGVFGDITLDRSAINAFRRTTDASFGSHTFYRFRTFNGTPLTTAQVEDLYYDNIVHATVVDSFLMEEGSGGTTTSEQSTVATITAPQTWTAETPLKARSDISVRRRSVQEFNNSLDLVKASSQRVLFGNILNFTETDSFSLSTRFKLKSYDNNASLWDKFASGGYRLVFNSAGLLLSQLRQADSTIQTVTAPTAPTLNVWHEAVVVFDTSTIKIYLDGVLVVSSAFTLADIGVVATQLTFGYSNNNATYLNSKITRSCIWSKALSASEVANLYYDGTIPTDNLEIHCDYSEGSGTTLGDISGNGNNGTITAGTAWSSDAPSQSRTDISVARTDI